MQRVEVSGTFTLVEPTPDPHSWPADLDTLRGAWAQASGEPAPEQARLAVAAWESLEPSPATLARLGELALRFAARLDATGVTSLLVATVDDCEGFVWAPTRRNRPPSMHTVHLRRTAIRGLYRAVQLLDPDVTDPSSNLELAAKHVPEQRALSDSEITMLRVAALGRPHQRLRRAAIVALSEATATTGEIPHITWNDVDLAESVVKLPGASPVRPRSGQLTPWGRGVLARFTASTTPERHGFVIARRGAADTTTPISQAAVVNQLSQLLAHAGITHTATRPGSVRLWAARQQLDRHGIEAAATALGIDSLDAAADALDHRWNQR